MVALTPQAYVYLRRPILSSDETMLYHTFQHLCFTDSLRVQFDTVEVGGGGAGGSWWSFRYYRNRTSRWTTALTGPLSGVALDKITVRLGRTQSMLK